MHPCHEPRGSDHKDGLKVLIEALEEMKIIGLVTMVSCRDCGFHHLHVEEQGQEESKDLRER